jgi:hypothetical protein
MKRQLFLPLALVVVVPVFSLQDNSAGQSKKSQTQDIDPLALQVLKAATDPIRDAKTYSFRAFVGTEQLGTNGQVITLFHVSDVTVQRPDKLHLDFAGQGQKVQFYFNAGLAALYAPSEKLYSSLSAKATIDAELEDLAKRKVPVPVKNFLQSDPYKSLTQNLRSAYVIGMVKIFDQPVHHLAFTEPGAEWQLWVIGGDNPRVRRLQVIDRSEAYQPRVTVDFLDWNLKATPAADLFTFNKPADAREVPILGVATPTIQQSGGK